MPTWFCHRNVFNKLVKLCIHVLYVFYSILLFFHAKYGFFSVPGGFSEAGHGTPEDLIFFYSHLDNNGQIFRTDEVILDYYYHPAATTFSIQQ